MQRQWDRVDFDPSPYQISLPYLTHFLCGYLSDASHMEQAFYLNSFEAVILGATFLLVQNSLKKKGLS